MRPLVEPAKTYLLPSLAGAVDAEDKVLAVWIGTLLAKTPLRDPLIAGLTLH